VTTLRCDSVTNIFVFNLRTDCVSFHSRRVVVQKLLRIAFSISFQFKQQLNIVFVYTYISSFIKIYCLACCIKCLVL
jgi:hypothetical protein